MDRYRRVFIAMALMLLGTAILVRGCNLSDLISPALAVDDELRDYLNDTYEAEGVGVSLLSQSRLLVTLINPEANNLTSAAAQELVAREIAQYVLANQEGLPELADVRVKFDTRMAPGAPVSEEIIFDFPVSDFE